jgi:hypothetical protein
MSREVDETEPFVAAVSGVDLRIVTISGAEVDTKSAADGMAEHLVGDGGEALGEFLEEEASPAADSYDPSRTDKDVFVENLDAEAVAMLGGVLKNFIPSKNSPEPASENDLGSGEIIKSNEFFTVAYSAANMLVNKDKFRWADGDVGQTQHGVIFEPIKKYPGGSSAPMFAENGVKLHEYNCSSLVSDEEARAIFGGLTADQVGYEVSCVVGLWTHSNRAEFEPRRGGKPPISARFVIGADALPDDVANSAAHYAAAIGGPLSELRGFARDPASKYGRHLRKYFEDKILDEKGFKSERECLDWLTSNPDEIDDVLWRPEALDWLNSARILSTENEHSPGNENSLMPEDQIERLKKIQPMVLEFTNLIDRRWRDKYEAEGLSALKWRFGHPVGIPEAVLVPHFFLPGGYLVESGWLPVTKGDGGVVFDVKLPVDSSGRPNSDSRAWDDLGQVAKVRDVSTLEGLGDLAEASASAAEAWHVAYNKGLPRDSLYAGAAISAIDQNINGNAYDDFSGSVRGLYHPMMKGVEVAAGFNASLYPTMRGKITALDSRLSKEEPIQKLTPRGAISVEEIDLANWRLARLSDNQCGNEYGVNSVKKGEREPHNFSLLERQYHEKIQKEIRSWEPDDGMINFVQDDGMVRPLIGVQRGEAVRTFVERPGTYLRRTGMGGDVFDGVPKAVLNQVKFPLTPPSAFVDFATGKTTDGGSAVSQKAGTMSLFPFATVARASGLMDLGEGFSGWRSAQFNKFLAIGPGRRGENFPRRLRFAAKSLGETPTAAGLVDPGLDKMDPAKSFVEVASIHTHVKEGAVVTSDAPVYSPELTKAAWHDPAVFARDFELGEMGSGYRLLANGDGDRKRLLQMLLAGKQTFRHRIMSPGVEILSDLTSYAKYHDAGLNYGSLKDDTGVYPFTEARSEKHRGKFNSAPGTFIRTRDGGLWRTFYVMGRSSGSFQMEDIPEAELGRENAEQGEDDTTRPPSLGNGGPRFIGGRGGHGKTGLEDLPVFFSGKAPIKSAKFSKEWTETAYRQAIDGEFEPYYNPDLKKRWKSRFADVYQDSYEKEKERVTIFGPLSHPTTIPAPPDMKDPATYYIEVDEAEMRSHQDEPEKARKFMKERLWPYLSQNAYVLALGLGTMAGKQFDFLLGAKIHALLKKWGRVGDKDLILGHKELPKFQEWLKKYRGKT